ncbi:MAG: tyrosine-type recombinase/integrase [Janthinobacterium lividum]
MNLHKRFPTLFKQPYLGEWLILQELSGLSPNTLSAYGYAMIDYLRFCENNAINPPDAKRVDITAYINNLTTRPKSVTHSRPVRRPGFIRSPTHEGLANATVRLRLAAVRLYYEYLTEEEVRATNPVKKGIYIRGNRFGGKRRGLVARYEEHPWLPDKAEWQAILSAASSEPIRNRFMLALAYDAGLRRGELCALQTSDMDPSERLLHLRAETTKNRRARVIPYSQTTGELYAAYLQQRRRLSKAPGPLFLSGSRRNLAQPLTFWTWSKIVHALGKRAGLPLLTTHTLRHLRLTDLAQAKWETSLITAFAGHSSEATTMLYIHMSGRDLNERFHQTLDSMLDWRQETIKTSLL